MWIALLCLLHPLAALAVDTDGDGLEDADETSTHGTNPTLFDTDADGVHDGDEVLHYPTDPLDDDSDDDRLKDGEEQLSASGFGPVRGITIPLDVERHVLDMNSDGLDDVAWSSINEAGFALSEFGANTPAFSAAQIISSKDASSTDGSTITSHAFLDFDHDGDPDLIRFEYWPEAPALVVWEFRFYENRLDEPTADFAAPVVLPEFYFLPTELHDLDGDGDLDFLSGTRWLRRDSDAQLPLQNLGQPIDAGWQGCLVDYGYGEFDSETVDLDGDDDLDIVVMCSQSAEVIWFENRLTPDGGAFEPAAPLLTLDGVPHGFEVANMDSTPLPEIVVLTTVPAGSNTDELVSLRVLANPFDLRRLGHARLPFAMELPTAVDPFLILGLPIEIADLDGDGARDIVVQSTTWHEPPYQGGLFWLRNQLDERRPRFESSGLITNSSLRCMGAARCEWFSLARLDADADLDLFTPIEAAPYFAGFENVIHRGSDPMLADSDGDGLEDGDEVTVHGTHPGRVDSDGDGLSDDEELAEIGTDPADPDSDDDGLIDGDERMPRAFRDGQVIATSGAGIGSYYCCILGTLQVGPAVELADMNADGVLDAVLGGDSDPGPWIENLLQASARGLVLNQTFYSRKDNGDPPTFALALDENRVPVAALAVDDEYTGITWHAASWPAPGVFAGFDFVGTNVANDTVEVWRVHAADFDGDGDADVLAADAGSGEVEWYENRLDEASADFSAANILDADAAGTEDATPVDLDQDGDLDVLAGAHDAAEIRYYENRLDEPTADFAPPVVVATEAVDVYRVDAFDFDDDGDLDPVGTSINGSYVVWYENRLDEGLPFVTLYLADEPLGFTAVLAIDGGDLDRDGDEDVVFIEGASSGNVVTVLVDGAETAVIPERADVGFEDLGDVELGDLDGDGDLDAVVTGFQAVAWLENWINFATAVDDPDSDDDGLLDGFEVEWGFDPLVSTPTDDDSDGDGLDLLAEQAANTSPLTDDTDGDRYTDGLELAEGSDPNDRLVIPVPEFGSGGFVVAAMAGLELLRRRRAS